MLLYGAGGHSKVIIDALRKNQQSPTGVFDDHAVGTILSIPIVGEYTPTYQPNEHVIIAIGNNKIRAQLAVEIMHPFGSVFHPKAYLASDVTIDEGTVVLVNAVVNTSATIGKHVIINTAAVVEHDCKIGDYVHIAPHVALCGHVEVGEGTLIGVGASVIPGVKIGANSIIEAGSSVIEDLPNHSLLKRSGEIISLA